MPANVATICDFGPGCAPPGVPPSMPTTPVTAQLAEAFEKVLVVPPTVSGVPPEGTVGHAYSFAFAVGGIPAVKVSHSGAPAQGIEAVQARRAVRRAHPDRYLPVHPEGLEREGRHGNRLRDGDRDTLLRWLCGRRLSGAIPGAED